MRLILRMGWFLGCLVLADLAANPPAQAREIRVTILYTTDLHGRLAVRPEPGSQADDAGSLLQVATLIEQARAGEPHALLVDCGDTVQGGPESYLSQGRAMFDAMAFLRYDAWVPGNHEFDWGLGALQALVNDAPFEVLGANLRSQLGTEHPLPRVRTHILREVEGIRIALVGLTTPGIPQWTLPDHLGDVIVEPALPALEKILPALRADRPEIRILLAHQGWTQQGNDSSGDLRSIARDFPEFDLVLGGHSHQMVPREIEGDTLFSQAGCHGKCLGRATLIYDTVARKVVRRTAELIPVTASVPEHLGLKARMQGRISAVDRIWTRSLGEAAEPIEARTRIPGASGIDQLLRAAILESSGAEIVLHGALVPERLDAGPILERDLWRIVPFDNRLGVVHLTFGDLRRILEENLELGGNRFMGLLGARATYDPSAEPGRRIRSLTLPDGSVPHARRRFRVALNSYILASGGGRFKELRRITEQPEARRSMSNLQTRDAVRVFIRKHSPLSFPADPPDGLKPAEGKGYSSSDRIRPRREPRTDGY
jgi:2',3'-cyclic-nucleotide 2'-phosphodiesterase (5'-nucleotidase family)